MDFVAIDFETATSKRSSVCAVGIVTVENSIIVDEYHTLIQPPNNEYNWHNTNVHGINEIHTRNERTFELVYPEIRERLYGQRIVAHNESFDRSVLTKSMLEIGKEIHELELEAKWDCTMKIFKKMGYPSVKLDYCCNRHRIQLQHHEALSDARGCAQLFLLVNKEILV